jgi:hypothetical protein
MQTSQQLNKPKLFLRASPNQRIIAAIVCVSITGFFSIFAVAGHYKIDMGMFMGRCGFKQNTGLPCPTCGMTTAALAFTQGKILEAFYLQPAGGLLYSLAVVAAVLAFIISVFGVNFRFLTQFFAEVKIRYIAIALIVIILAGWAVTMARALSAGH